MFRDQTFSVMQELWSLNMKAREKMEKKASSNQSSIEEFVSHVHNKQSESEYSEVLSSTTTNTDEYSQDESDQETDPIGSPQQSNHHDDDDEHQDDLIIHAAKDANNKPSPTISSTTNQSSTNQSSSSNQDGAGAGGEGPPPSNNDNNNNDKNNNKNNNNNNNNNKPNEKKFVNDDKYIINHDITDASQIPPTNTFHADSKFKVHTIFDELIPASTRDIFHVLFADGCSLEINHHASRHDTNLQVSPWTASADSIGMLREMNFVSPVTAPLGPNQTRVKMDQRMVIMKDRSCYYVQNVLWSMDVPYNDTFRIQCGLTVMRQDANHSRLIVTTGVVFLKGTLLKWKIEETAVKESTESYRMWATQAKQAVLQCKEQGTLWSDGIHHDQSNGHEPTSTSKKAQRRKKKPAPIQTNVAKNVISRSPVTATKIITHTPFDNIGSAGFEMQNKSMALQIVAHIVTLVTKCFDLIRIPSLLFVLFFVLFFLLLMPNQNKRYESLQFVENDIAKYTRSNELFDGLMSRALKNDTMQRVHLNQELKGWVEERYRSIYSGKDSAFMRNVIQTIAEKQTTVKKDYNTKDTMEVLLERDLIQRQQQQRQMDVITWSLVVLVVSFVAKTVLSMFGILKN
ncbi:hypothetical protein AKO1_013263 [Acrasis kona]|uniref:VASt domain-containing protein n=1 Tax=Acrasis kona TaxID=1008807 RepID=A0AAW2YYZ9_9EUKA